VSGSLFHNGLLNKNRRTRYHPLEIVTINLKIKKFILLLANLFSAQETE
jgi:hypothetical protein